LRLEVFQPEHLSELVPMWRASFEAAVGIVDPHPIAEQEAYFLERVLPRHAVRLAWQGGQLVGFVAASADTVAQLYVRQGWQRRGIGGAMLGWAKRQSGGRLTLFTFARNLNACAFYEHNGFVVAARGFEPEWQLDDVKYVWTAPTTT
jgi:GNAT superfamily N-acetyltransferase